MKEVSVLADAYSSLAPPKRVVLAVLSARELQALER
jgi:hypothetical protein